MCPAATTWEYPDVSNVATSSWYQNVQVSGYATQPQGYSYEYGESTPRTTVPTDRHTSRRTKEPKYYRDEKPGAYRTSSKGHSVNHDDRRDKGTEKRFSSTPVAETSRSADTPVLSTPLASSPVQGDLPLRTNPMVLNSGISSIPTVVQPARNSLQELEDLFDLATAELDAQGPSKSTSSHEPQPLYDI